MRDQVRHSGDHRLNPTTCSASEVLRHRTGYCYAKSHLLCALLRASGIPAGLCYQRLTVDENSERFCLHGLCAVKLPRGWYRVDPRGNRDGIDAQFCPPFEQLAFSTDLEGECDFPMIHATPLPAVVDVLRKYSTWRDVADHLPDTPPAGAESASSD